MAITTVLETPEPLEVAGYRRILNCLPSRRTGTELRLADARRAGMLSGDGEVLDALDLRQDWWDVSDQKQTGACVGFSSADGVLRYTFVTAGKIDEPGRLSERYVWMGAKETDDITDYPSTFIESAGTTLKAALELAKNYGVVAYDQLPFDGTLYADETGTFFAAAAQRKISSYFDVGTDPSGWREWMSAHGPILTRLEVDKTWDDATSTSGNLDAYQPGTTRGGHAVAMVGYTADRIIVRNSWGTTWGDGGFAYASDDYAKAAFTEAYGVVV